jgi:protein TonB
MAQWGGRVRGSVERTKRYPRGNRDSGRVTLRITLSHAGRLQGVTVARSSGHDALDRAALAAVQQARFPAAPRGLEPGNHSFNLPVSFDR